MRDRIGVLLVEQGDGRVAVQLFAVPEQAVESFKQLGARSTDTACRATFISLDYANKKSSVRVKPLGVGAMSEKANAPDGVVLGEGPVWLDKEAGGG